MQRVAWVLLGVLAAGGLVAGGLVLLGVRDVQSQAERDLASLQEVREAEDRALRELEAMEPPPWRLLVLADGTVTHRGLAVSPDALEPPQDVGRAEIAVEPGAPQAAVTRLVDAVRAAGVADVAITLEPPAP